MLFIEHLRANSINAEVIRQAHHWILAHLGRAGAILPIRSTGHFNAVPGRTIRGRLLTSQGQDNLVFSDNEFAVHLYHHLAQGEIDLTMSLQEQLISRALPVAHARAKREGDGHFRFAVAQRFWGGQNTHCHVFDAGCWRTKDAYAAERRELVSRFVRLAHPMNHFIFPNGNVRAEQNGDPRFQFVAAVYFARLVPAVFDEFIKLIQPGDLFNWNPNWRQEGEAYYETLMLPNTTPTLDAVVIPEGNGDQLVLRSSGCYFSESDYQKLIGHPYESVRLIVLGGKGENSHPRGIYLIPRADALEFIEAKRRLDTWRNHRCWSSSSVPGPLRPFFAPD